MADPTKRDPNSLRSNPEKYRAYRTKWIKEKRRKDRAFADNEIKKTQEWQKKNPMWALWIAYTTRCKRFGREFALSREVFEKLLVQDCFYCGVEANPLNSIDRLDPKHGYFVGNVVTACNDCNRAKMDKSLVEFEEWLMRIHRHYFKREAG